jgi:hemolysin III
MGFVPDATRYRRDELAADRAIHLLGIILGSAGAVTMVGVAAPAGRPIVIAVVIYAVSLVTMLECSAAYHLSGGFARRGLLRRLDHAAIFLLIAGTYTPFTTCRLQGVWAVGMTAAVWIGALAGAAIKLICPHRLIGVSTAIYLALGWIILIGARPIIAAVDPSALALVAVGGALYSIGAGVHLWRSLPFHNAIWHAMVLAAAACHYAAILCGVVLAT